MESTQSSSSSYSKKASKIKVPPGMKISPLIINGIGSWSPSVLSPQSAVENWLNLTPPAVEEGEEALVMEGVPVRDSSGAEEGRSPLMLWSQLELILKQRQLERESILMDTREEDWCPQDDGIEVIDQPHSSSTMNSPYRESVNAYIDGVLSGHPNKWKRLPVFFEICSD